MNLLRQKRQYTLLKVFTITYFAMIVPALSQVEPPSTISQEEYDVISVALGKRNERVFMEAQSRRFFVTLRDAISAHQPAQTGQHLDPALTRPRREPTEDMKKWFRQEKARRQDEDAFKADISGETVSDFMEKNTTSYEWEDHFHLVAPVVLLTRRLNEELPRDPVVYWEQLRTKYPDLGAIEEASRVGVNFSGNQAVVLVGYHTGLIGGEGQYILLEKENGRWEIKHRLRAWLS